MDSYTPWRVLETKLCCADHGAEAWNWVRNSSCDLNSLLDFLLEPHEPSPAASCQPETLTKIEAMPRPLRGNLLCMVSLVVPRFSSALLKRVLHLLVDRRTPGEIAAHWDTRIAAELLHRLDPTQHSRSVLVDTSTAQYSRLAGHLRAATTGGPRLPMVAPCAPGGAGNGSSKKRGRESTPSEEITNPTPKLVRTGRWVHATAHEHLGSDLEGALQNGMEPPELALHYTQESQSSQSLEQQLPVASQATAAHPAAHGREYDGKVRGWAEGSEGGGSQQGLLLLQSPPPPFYSATASSNTVSITTQQQQQQQQQQGGATTGMQEAAGVPQHSVASPQPPQLSSQRDGPPLGASASTASRSSAGRGIVGGLQPPRAAAAATAPENEQPSTSRSGDVAHAEAAQQWAAVRQRLQQSSPAAGTSMGGGGRPLQYSEALLEDVVQLLEACPSAAGVDADVSDVSSPFAACVRALAITESATEAEPEAGGTGGGGGGGGVLFSDEAVLVLSKRILSEELRCSYRLAAAYVAHVLHPRVLALRQPASRALLAAVLHAGATQPQAVLEQLVVVLLAQPVTLGAAQAEVALRALRDGVPRPLLPPTLYRVVVQVRAQAAASGGQAAAWGEPALHAWHTLLSLKLRGLDEAIEPGQGLAVTDASRGAERAAVIRLLVADILVPMLDERRASLKYCNVLFALVKHYGAALLALQLDGDVERCLQQCTSFVRKPALAALGKIRAGK